MRPAGRGSVTTTLVASTGPVLVTVNVYGTWLPGTICVTDDDFTIESCGWTGNGTVDSHSGPPLPSGGQLVLGAVTVALWRPVGSVGGRERTAASVTMLTGTAAPAARSPSAQVTVTPSADEQPGLSEDTNVKPAGNTSETTTAVAVTGPLFVTVNVYGTGAPGTICVTEEVLLIETAAD